MLTFIVRPSLVTLLTIWAPSILPFVIIQLPTGSPRSATSIA